MPDNTFLFVNDKQQWQIEQDQVGMRLDRYLTAVLQNMSRTSVQQIITDGQVLVNQKSSRSGYILRINDLIQIIQPEPAPPVRKLDPAVIALDIAYEDQDLLIINKPAGLVVHPAPGHQDDTLVNALVNRYPELEGQMDSTRPGIVHRLDKDTSGALLVAKNLRSQAALVDLMKEHAIEKRYLALVEGVVALDRGSIDAPIGRDQRNRQQMTITAVDSRQAKTYFRVKQRFERHTLLALQLETGRTHQIRVHLKAIGYPVVGDPVYGSGRTIPGIDLKRQFLHAYQLRFQHPFAEKIVDVEIPLPVDLQQILDKPERL